MLSWLVLGLDRLTCFGFGYFECDDRQVLILDRGFIRMVQVSCLLVRLVLLLVFGSLTMV